MGKIFLKILGKSLKRRKSRVTIAVLAVVMSASIVSALFSTSITLEDKISEEFRKFGANIIVLPKSDMIDVGLPGISFGSITEQRYINETDLWRIKKIPTWSANVLGYAPFLYQVVNVTHESHNQSVVLAGTYFSHNESMVLDAQGIEWVTGLHTIVSWWEVEGNWVGNSSDLIGSMVGTTVASKLGLDVGTAFNVIYRNPETGNFSYYALEVRGIITSGGDEDSQVFVNLDVAQGLTERDNKIHAVQVSALCNKCPAETIAAEIEVSLPTVQARSVKQLVNSEREIMMQIENIMILITILTVGASILGVMTTLTTTVIERRTEIGLMKAIGAENKKVAKIFLVEATLIGLIGGAAGYLAGNIISMAIEQSVFGSFLLPTPLATFVIILVTIGIAVGIALLASILPVRRAVGIEPAIVMKGE